MSRIGKKHIEIPAGVIVTVTGNIVEVKGQKGSMTFEFSPEVFVNVENNNVVVTVKDDLKRLFPLWGLTRAMIANMITGVTSGFEKKLELIGVGYRAKQNGNDGVTLSLGFSHPVEFKAPKGVEIQVVDQSNIVIKGYDKQLVGLTAANIRKLRKPEPYKGKGIKYAEEIVRRKAGKAGKTGAK